jgi:endoglucanase
MSIFKMTFKILRRSLNHLNILKINPLKINPLKINPLKINSLKTRGDRTRQPRRRSQFRSSLHHNPAQFTRWLRWLLVSLLSMGLFCGLSLPSPAPMAIAQSSPVIATPLSTRRAEIIDANGQTVWLRGVNWFGIETELQVPHGLWKRDYKDMLAQIKSLGYNLIRLPYSVQALRSDYIDGVDFGIAHNQELQGKTPLEAMDLVIQEAERQGLLVLLDSHRLNNQRIPELWYGDGFSEEDWIGTWTMLATRYRNQANVIGADLKNEPHGRASWGTGDRATDWRLAAERAGNAILEVNPNWLIVVEGVEGNVPGQQLSGHWQGGNLEGVRNHPVRLSQPEKLVYSTHEYGQGVFDQPWFSEPTFPQNLYHRWEIGFHYIATQAIAPILIGEFGGRQVDDQSKEGIWQRQFVRYIDQNHLSFAYWSWNPNSADTGGILTDDWQSIDQPKQQLLSQLLPFAPAVSSPSSTHPNPLSFLFPTPSPVPSSGSSTLRTEMTIQSEWESGFCVSFRITNPNTTSIRNWRLSFEMDQAAITQSWNGNFIRQRSTFTVTPPDWANEIQPNQGVDMGFCANKTGSNYLPQHASVIAPI